MTRRTGRLNNSFTAFPHIRPTLAVPATERWFWTDEWQAGEQEVDAYVRAGDFTVTKDADEFLGSLPGGSA